MRVERWHWLGMAAPTERPLPPQCVHALARKPDVMPAHTLWQVPHPEIQRFEVSANEHQRVVLASDGVWDFLSEVRVFHPSPNLRPCNYSLNLQP